MANQNIGDVLFVSEEQARLKKIPHVNSGICFVLPPNARAIALGAEPNREWINLVTTDTKNRRVYGWLNRREVQTLNKTGQTIKIDKLPITTYAHNSRQDILDLMTAIRKQSIADFQASGRRTRAFVWTSVLSVAGLAVGGILIGDLAVAALLSFIIGFFVWLLWVAGIWNRYSRPQELQRLHKVQLSKRTPVEVFGDGVKTAGQIALGLGVLAATAAIATSQSKPSTRRVVKSSAKTLSASAAAASSAARQAQQVQQRRIAMQQQAAQRQRAAAERAEQNRQIQMNEEAKQARDSAEAKRRQWEADVDDFRWRNGLA